MVNASCHADCQAQASATLNCSPPQLQIVVTGDDALFTSFQTRQAELGAALQATLQLKDPIASVASQTVTTFGSVTAAGAGCVTSQLSLAANVQASITVSVSASASVQGKS
jgi:hypothetical protein